MVAVVLRDDLAVWQKTNFTAFLVSGSGLVALSHKGRMTLLASQQCAESPPTGMRSRASALTALYGGSGDGG